MIFLQRPRYRENPTIEAAPFEKAPCGRPWDECVAHVQVRSQRRQRCAICGYVYGRVRRVRAGKEEGDTVGVHRSERMIVNRLPEVAGAGYQRLAIDAQQTPESGVED